MTINSKYLLLTVYIGCSFESPLQAGSWSFGLLTHLHSWIQAEGAAFDLKQAGFCGRGKVRDIKLLFRGGICQTCSDCIEYNNDTNRTKGEEIENHFMMQRRGPHLLYCYHYWTLRHLLSLCSVITCFVLNNNDNSHRKSLNTSLQMEKLKA